MELGKKEYIIFLLNKDMEKVIVVGLPLFM